MSALSSLRISRLHLPGTVRPERLSQWKIPMTPSGIEPTTSRLFASLHCRRTTIRSIYSYVTNTPKLNAVIPQLDTSPQPLTTNTLTYDYLQITATHNKAVFDGKLDRPMAASYQQFLQVTVTGNNVHTMVGTLIVATIYLQLIQNRYMFRSFTVLQCSHQHCVQPVASDVEVVGLKNLWLRLDS